MALLMLVTPVCFPGFVLALFLLLNKVLKVLELSALLAITNTDSYPLFYVVWHIIMHHEPLYYFPFADTESDYQLCYVGWDRYI